MTSEVCSNDLHNRLDYDEKKKYNFMLARAFNNL